MSSDVFHPHYGEVLARIATALEGKAPDAAREYVVFFEDWSDPPSDRRCAMRVKAYTSDEAVKQVQQRRQHIFSQLANFVVVPFDASVSLHRDCLLNEAIGISESAKF